MDNKRKEKEPERLLSKPILFQSKSCQPIRWPKHQATDQGKVGKESFLSNRENKRANKMNDRINNISDVSKLMK